MEALNTLLETSRKAKAEMCFIASDQNYDLLKLELHKPTREFLAAMYEENYVPMILKPTRSTHRSSTLIDNIYVQARNLQQNCSFVMVDGMSDHFPSLLNCAINAKKNNKKIVVEKRKLSENALLKIQQDLLLEDWSPINDMNVDSSYEFLIQKIRDKLDKHAPIKKVVLTTDCHFREAWLTVRIKKCNVKCRKLCEKAKLSG